jgi:hypothetical protein
VSGPIFDAHMHVGDFGPMFNVSLDRDGLAALVDEYGYEGCCVFHPDNEYVRTVVESIPEAWCGGTRACPATSRRSSATSTTRSFSA